MRIDDFTRLQAKLVAEEKMSFPYAAILADLALNRFDERVRKGVILWLDGKLTEDFEVEDYTVYEILDDLDGSMFQALCIMDMLLKDPEAVRNIIWTVAEDTIYG